MGFKIKGRRMTYKTTVRNITPPQKQTINERIVSTLPRNKLKLSARRAKGIIDKTSKIVYSKK